MTKKYQKKTSRSKKKLQKIKKNTVKVDSADRQATFQINIPLLIKALISIVDDKEVAA